MSNHPHIPRLMDPFVRRLLAMLLVGVLAVASFVALFHSVARATASQASLKNEGSPLTTKVITQTWENLGIYGGIISALAVDSADNPPHGVVYAGTTSGQGLYRTLDGGDSWTGVYTSSVQALGVNETDHIVWGISQQGIITSADRGATWNPVPYPSGIFGWAQLVVNGRTTLLASGNTVARSTDGGATWATAALPCSGCQVSGLTLDSLGSRIFAATNTDVYVSDLATLSFSVTGTGHGMQGIISLAASPHIADLLYAGTGDLGGSVRHSVFRSTDAGATWSKIYDAGSAVAYIVFHPALTQTVYLAGTKYDGSSFTPMGFGAGNSELAIHSSAPYTMYGTLDQGVNRSTDGGASFQAANQGIDGVVVQDFAQNPRDLGVFFVNTKNGLGRTFNGGVTWDFPFGFSHFGGAVAAPYSDTTYTQRAFLGEYFSSDYGDNVMPLGNPSLRSQIEGSGCTNCFAVINGIDADPANPDIVYAAVGGFHNPSGSKEEPHGGLWASSDGGTTWTQHTTNYSASYATLPYTTPARLVAFSQGGTAYAVLGDFRNHTNFGGNVFGGVISRTTTSAWQLLATTTNPITASVEGLAIDPNNPLHIWVGTGYPQSRLFHSEDGGVTWDDRTPIGGAMGAFQAIAVHPTNSQIVFAAARNDVYLSDDDGLTWTLLLKPPTGAATSEAIQRILLPILPPASVTGLSGSVTGGTPGAQLNLSWTNPSDGRFQGVIIRGDASKMPRTSVEGTAHGTIISPTNSATIPLPADPYSVTVIPYDSQGRYGVGTQVVVNGSTVTVLGSGSGFRLQAAAAQGKEAVVAGTPNGLFQLPLDGVLGNPNPDPTPTPTPDPTPTPNPTPTPSPSPQQIFLPLVNR